MVTRVCYRCKISKPIESFSKTGSRSRCVTCRSCVVERAAIYRAARNKIARENKNAASSKVVHIKDLGRPVTVHAVSTFGKGKHNGLGMFEPPCDNDDPLNYVYPE